MANLYPHLRAHQVFGANTDVGKTIFTTALCLASAALPLSGDAATLEQDVYTAAASSRGERVHYLKPVSTGALTDSDDAHISKFAPGTRYTTLYRFSEPVSPHLAVELERRAKLAEREVGQEPAPPTDAEFVRAVGDWIHSSAGDASTVQDAARRQLAAVAYVETAGGVHSPGPSGVSQTHLLRPLRLPTILIGSSELGGISTTRSAFESLLVAGYDVDAVLLFPSHRYGNVEYLRKFFLEEHNIPVFGLGGPSSSSSPSTHPVYGPPPAKHADLQQDVQAMRRFYDGLVRGKSADQIESAEEDAGGVYSVVRHLRQRHARRIKYLGSMAQRTRDTCWWPFTQHQLTTSNDQVNVIDSAHGDFFSCLDQRPHHSSGQQQGKSGSVTSLLQPVYDGSASWWTQCLGHAPQRLVLAAANAGGRYGHVLFPNGTHEPALHLSERLIGKSPTETTADSAKSSASLESHPGAGWADRVFFSDDGSTGMEVALKMALQSSIMRYTYPASSEKAADKSQPGRQAGYQSGRKKQEWEVLGLKGSYHGDTIGTMDACEPSVYSEAVHWYRGRGFWFDPPTVEIRTSGETSNAEPTATVCLNVADSDDRSKILSSLPDTLSSTSTSSDDASQTVLSQSYPSLQHVYDVETRLQSDPLAQVYAKMIRSKLEQLIVEQGRKFGALVLEPLVMGAGGMVFVDPLFQRVLIDTCRDAEDLFRLTDAPLKSSKVPRSSSSSSSPGSCGDKEWRGIPVIFDEVFAGLYRLGPCTPASVLGVTPDISVLAKILTGGMVPMSVTLASSSIFSTFNRSQSKVDALLHGHSYTAHPIGCAVALETLKTIDQLKTSPLWSESKRDWLGSQPSSHATGRQDVAPKGVWSFWSKSAADEMSKLPNVDHVMAMGCVLKVCLKDTTGAGGYTSTASADILSHLRYGLTQQQGNPSVPFPVAPESSETSSPRNTAESTASTLLLPYNIHARPLGNVIYLMSSLNTPTEVLRNSERVLHSAIANANTTG
ncbi:PLP-dependent transferase [Testicularia cyperi]|uniref:PLP-dependent transferase n=1 Tax=Testicularia cyperi TaxID=1882483 RepID=A0A317XNP6_9BASI|nr:PLP-dependent transferase [Testicularia cyperi]